jgi:hypothetical protein
VGITSYYAHIKIPAPNTATKKNTNTGTNTKYKKRNKILIQKETVTQLGTISLAHTERKHMAMHMDQHRTINKPNVTTGNKQQTNKKQQQKNRNLCKSQATNTTRKITHYPRVINSTNTQFTPEEIKLLSKGLKYNLHHKHKHWIEAPCTQATHSGTTVLSSRCVQ